MADDKGKVVMAFRMDRDLREAIHQYAKEETRTTANWIEKVLLCELQRRSNPIVTADSFECKLERLLALIKKKEADRMTESEGREE